MTSRLTIFLKLTTEVTHENNHHDNDYSRSVSD